MNPYKAPNVEKPSPEKNDSKKDVWARHAEVVSITFGITILLVLSYSAIYRDARYQADPTNSLLWLAEMPMALLLAIVVGVIASFAMVKFLDLGNWLMRRDQD